MQTAGGLQQQRPLLLSAMWPHAIRSNVLQCDNDTSALQTPKSSLQLLVTERSGGCSSSGATSQTQKGSSLWQRRRGCQVDGLGSSASSLWVGLFLWRSEAPRHTSTPGSAYTNSTGREAVVLLQAPWQRDEGTVWACSCPSTHLDRRHIVPAHCKRAARMWPQTAQRLPSAAGTRGWHCCGRRCRPMPTGACSCACTTWSSPPRPTRCCWPTS